MVTQLMDVQLKTYTRPRFPQTYVANQNNQPLPSCISDNINDLEVNVILCYKKSENNIYFLFGTFSVLFKETLKCFFQMPLSAKNTKIKKRP